MAKLVYNVGGLEESLPQSGSWLQDSYDSDSATLNINRSRSDQRRLTDSENDDNQPKKNLRHDVAGTWEDLFIITDIFNFVRQLTLILTLTLTPFLLDIYS